MNTLYDQRSTLLIVGACLAVSLVLGSVHAFSVFVPGWQELPGADRGSLSLVYSIALVSLTLVVLVSHRIFARLSPSTIFSIVGIVSAGGLYLSAKSSSLNSLYLFYGVLFGASNGLGYGYTLQLAGQIVKKHQGLTMALVTANYAVGATLAPVLLVWLIGRGGNSQALTAAALIIFIVCMVAAVIVRLCRSEYTGTEQSALVNLTAQERRLRLMLWFGYGAAVTAGLMIIGHAFGVAIWMNIPAQLASLAPALVALGNMLGGFSAGFIVERYSNKRLLQVLPALSSVGLVLLLIPFNFTWVRLLALAIVGYGYGAIIALYPVVVAQSFGRSNSARVYGQVFTAWGTAGLLGPWLSGLLYDRTESYFGGVVLAVSLSVVSLLVIRASVIPTVSQSLMSKKSV